MLTESQAQAAAQVVEGLRQEAWTARVQVASSSSFFNGEIRATVLHQLDLLDARIDDLEGRQLDLVRDGKLLFHNPNPYTAGGWSAIAEAIHDGINYQAGLTSEWSFSGVISATLGATYDEVKEGAATAAGAASSSGGLLGLGVIAGLLLALWVVA